MWIVIATAIGVFCGNKFLCDAAHVDPPCVDPLWREGHRWSALVVGWHKVIRPRWVGAALDSGLPQKTMKPFTMSQITSYLFSNEHEMVEMKNNRKSLQYAYANHGD
jgi:hypothetical protein